MAVVPVFRPMRALRFLRFLRLFRLYRFGLLAHRFARTFEPRQFETAPYFVTPFDVLPEEVHGAEGYVDQVYLCFVAIDRLRPELPEHVA